MSTDTRIYNACLECRKRKVKCDGQLPNCANCLKRFTTCDYKPRSKTRVRTNLKQVDSLKKEIEFLRNELMKYTGSHKSISPVSSSETSSEDHSSVELLFDGLKSNADQDSEIYEIIVSRQKPSLLNHQFQQLISKIGKFRFTTLLQNYWNYENIHIMVIWRYLFYSFIMTDTNDWDTLYYSDTLILSMLSIGSNFSSDDDLILIGKTCHELSQTLIKDELNEEKITTIQTLCLLCIYESYSNNKKKLYYSKLAINKALKMKLNEHYQQSDSTLNDLKQISYRFVWWGCYLIDMLVRSDIGRPSTIKKEITDNAVEPPQVSPSLYKMELMNHNDHTEDNYFEFSFITTFTFELFINAGEVKRKIYLPNSKLTLSEKQKLTDHSLDTFLQFWDYIHDHYKNSTEILNSLQFKIFELRFYYAIIIINGYFIISEMNEPDQHELESIKLCLKYSEKLIIGFKNFDKEFGLKSLEIFAREFPIKALVVLLCSIHFNDNLGLDIGKSMDLLKDCCKIILSINSNNHEIYKEKQLELDLLGADFEVNFEKFYRIT